jgi:DNA processing protein
MNKSEQIARLRLIRTRNFGPITCSLLMRRYEPAEAAIPTLAHRGGSKISLASIASVKVELESIDAAGAVLIWRGSEYYLGRPAQFDDEPALITVRGNLHLLTQPMIAIVGARNASINAQRHAHNIASDLGKHGYIIVSGIARGIDAAAHREALDNGTIGAIAGGIDIVHPPENAELFAEVAARRLLYAEMPTATKPTPRHFPIRNRVVASLAFGVVVAEDAHRSGLLTTAREAATHGCDVIAVPESQLDPRSDGCNRLNRDGARLVQNVADVIECVSRQPTVTMPPAQIE